LGGGVGKRGESVVVTANDAKRQYGNRASAGLLRVFDLLNVGPEEISALGYGLDTPGLAAKGERPSQIRDISHQAAVADKGSRPHAIQQRLFRYDLAAVFHEDRKRLDRLRRQRH